MPDEWFAGRSNPETTGERRKDTDMVATTRRFGREIVTVFFLVLLLGGSVFAARVAASADQPAEDLTGHPLVGVWLALVPGAPGTPAVANPTIFTADGQVMLVAPGTRSEQNGVSVASGGIGTWESTGERSGAFTAVRVLSDADGTYLGTATIEGHLTVSEDGQTNSDTSPRSKVTFRNPAGEVAQVVPGYRDLHPVTSTRIVAGADREAGPTCGQCGPLES